MTTRLEITARALGVVQCNILLGQRHGKQMKPNVLYGEMQTRVDTKKVAEKSGRCTIYVQTARSKVKNRR